MNKKAAMEALLFSSPDPISPDEIGRILSMEVAHVNTLLHQLKEEYAGEERGFYLDEAGGGFRLASKPQYGSVIEELGKVVRTAPLSKAALETLAIIAYRQPITRPEIEAIRGVRVGSSLGALTDRGLIEERGRAEGPGRPILYGTTRTFLIRFGLDDIKDLPPLDEVREQLEQLKEKTDDEEEQMTLSLVESDG